MARWGCPSSVHSMSSRRPHISRKLPVPRQRGSVSSYEILGKSEWFGRGWGWARIGSTQLVARPRETSETGNGRIGSVCE